MRYTTIQNWSNNVYNLVTKRAVAYRNATVEWVDGNFGSKVTMKYPAIILKEEGAKGQIISIAVAGKGQHQDAGGKIIHLAPRTTSNIVAKSISKEGGRASYRGITKGGQRRGWRAMQKCNAMRCYLIPFLAPILIPRSILKKKTLISATKHQSVISMKHQLFYLMARGLSEAQRAR